VTYRIFISYSGPVDHKYAKYVRDRIEALGLGCIISEDRITNELLSQKILRDIRSATHMILLVSASTGSSAWPHQEVGYFVAKNSKSKMFVVVRGKRQPESRRLGILHDMENIRAERLRRSSLKTSRRRNEFTLECVLDKLTTLLIRKRMVKLRNGQARLRTRVDCCGTNQWLNTTIRIEDDGKIILLEPYTCPTHQVKYTRDPMTWSLVPVHALEPDSLEIADRLSFRIFYPGERAVISPRPDADQEED